MSYPYCLMHTSFKIILISSNLLILYSSKIISKYFQKDFKIFYFEIFINSQELTKEGTGRAETPLTKTPNVSILHKYNTI